MGLFRRRQRADDMQHAVLVHLPPPRDDDDLRLDEIEDSIIEALDAAQAGELDGNAMGPEGANLYLYGPDGDRLFAAIEPILRRARLPVGSRAVIHYGEPGASERAVDL